MRGLSLATVFASVALSQARTIHYTFDVNNTYVQPDGYKRSAITINGQTPGPVITGTKGDDFLIHTNNHLYDHRTRVSTTIHWHGILQHHTAYDDGPAFVTQCPIAPNASYPYHIKTGDQAGTFWYHSHLSTQYIDGLRGALIIYDPDDPHKSLYDVDNLDTVIQLTDWYHTSAELLGQNWLHNLTPEPVPDTQTFNGVGRYRLGPQIARPVINVVKGKRYRLRVINQSGFVPFNFTIQGHPMTIIEVDGVAHQPLTVTSFMIHAGQRYSVVINANQAVNNYWIAYPSNFRRILVDDVNPNYNGTEAYAVLRYKGAPLVEPKGSGFGPPVDGTALAEQNLVPLESPPPPGANETIFPVYLNFTRPDPPPVHDFTFQGGGNNWTVNGIQYQPPDVPTLLQILTNTGNQSEGLPPDVYVLPINTIIDIYLFGGVNHPFHLHGHTFQVIKSAEGPVNEKNPPIRDVVVSGNGHTPETGIRIRFKTDNPGPWFLHCHKDWHLEAGLAVVFAEDPAGMSASIEPTPEWNALCDLYNKLPARDQ